MKPTENRLNIQTRLSDLDSQRHVNSASYLSFAEDGQYALLKRKGFDYSYLKQNNTFLCPVTSRIRFLRQQLPQVSLEVVTNVLRDGDKVYWRQEIINPDSGQLCCEINTASKITGLSKDILDFIDHMPFLEVEVSNLKDFSGDCKRSMMTYEVRHIDLDGFNNFSTNVLWRLNEEARWNFMKESGIPFEYLLENDVALFWIEGIYEYFTEAHLDDSLKILTWIDRFDKVRIYIRQEILNSSNQRISFTEGEFLSVALSTSKPKRIPNFIKEAFSAYVDNLS